MELNGLRYIHSGEKFALIALRTHTNELPAAVELAPGVVATSVAPVEFDHIWKEWLGTFRVEAFEKSHIFLLAKIASENAIVLDHESIRLEQLAWRLLVGLLLSARIKFDEPDVLVGGCDNTGVHIRQHREYPAAAPFLGFGADPITENMLRGAWEVAKRIGEWNETGPAWRINKVLSNYIDARSYKPAPEQIHQFCRCVEGFLLPDIGNTKSQFKSKTELFIGPREHDLIGKIYDARSKVEHLHYEDLISKAGRIERIELTRQALIMEGLARHCFNRLLASRALWQHFKTDDALGAFWKLDKSVRESLWGPIVGIGDLVNGFEERWISNHDLGLEE